MDKADWVQRMVTRETTQELLTALARSILDGVEITLEIYGEDGDTTVDSDLMAMLQVPGEPDSILRCTSLKELLSAFRHDEWTEGEDLIPNISRFRAISDHARTLANELERIARDAGLAAEVPNWKAKVPDGQ